MPRTYRRQLSASEVAKPERCCRGAEAEAGRARAAGMLRIHADSACPGASRVYTAATEGRRLGVNLPLDKRNCRHGGSPGEAHRR